MRRTAETSQGLTLRLVLLGDTLGYATPGTADAVSASSLPNWHDVLEVTLGYWFKFKPSFSITALWRVQTITPYSELSSIRNVDTLTDYILI